MNEAARDVEDAEAEQPQDEENYCQRPEHSHHPVQRFTELHRRDASSSWQPLCRSPPWSTLEESWLLAIYRRIGVRDDASARDGERRQVVSARAGIQDVAHRPPLPHRGGIGDE